ncbi:F-box/kelch-repeat protein At3g23880-like [Primulina tabacum]|uniref:F-box/kelch-repeat protein At3g23880-like n=1 Tax=Primulina tabacum TaxID=48773 RepID=UPI003F59EC16
MAALDRTLQPLSNSNLPDDMVVEILMHLPVKTLTQFKLVSKSWDFLISSHDFAKAHFLISSHDFAKTHFNSIKNDHRLLFGSSRSPMDMYCCSVQSAVEDSVPTIYPPLNQNLIVQPARLPPLYRPHESILIEGSCNGLVCVSIGVRILILWNPTTGKFRTLPKAGTDFRNNFFNVSYAFGYNKLQDDYNVLEYFQYKSGETILKVYSVRSDSWRTVSDWPGRSGHVLARTGIFWNGAIFWLMLRPVGMDQIVFDLVSHQLSTDIFTVLPLPPGLEKDSYENSEFMLDLTVLSGSLASCIYRIAHFEIWFLKKKAWTKAAHLPFPVGLTCENLKFQQ